MGALYKPGRADGGAGAGGGLALFLVLAVAMSGSLLHAPLAGNFYAIFPHNFLAQCSAPCSSS
jgi:citrate/tricarballylate utilization protein